MSSLVFISVYVIHLMWNVIFEFFGSIRGTLRSFLGDNDKFETICIIKDTLGQDLSHDYTL